LRVLDVAPDDVQQWNDDTSIATGGAAAAPGKTP
jgi:hypothetical protein